MNKRKQILRMNGFSTDMIGEGILMAKCGRTQVAGEWCFALEQANVNSRNALLHTSQTYGLRPV